MKGGMEIGIEVWANVEDCIAVVKGVDGPNQLELEPDYKWEICKEKNILGVLFRMWERNQRLPDYLLRKLDEGSKHSFI